MSPRVYRRWPRISTLAFLLLLSAAGYQWLVQYQRAEEHVPANEVHVLEVVDGSTLLVANAADEQAAFQLRLMGIQIIEQSAAVAWLQQRSLGKRLRLEFDKRRIDQDEAWLAYVFLEDQLLNAELVRLGFARPARYPGDSTLYAKLLEAAAAK